MLSFSAIHHNDEVPDNFIYLREVIHDIEVDLRYCSDNNFTGRRVPGYEAERLIVTLDAAMALGKIQQELLYGNLALKIFDGYRPQRAVDHFIAWAHDGADTSTKAAYYPNVDKDRIFPEGYLVEKSSHSRGSTVDLTLIDKSSGEELDMGTPFDFFDLLSWPGSLEVSLQQRANRMLLRNVMQRHGFVGVEEEWWHFTLKSEPWPDTYFNFPVR
jgi:D-alanyl-D-alanine dipeptidase